MKPEQKSSTSSSVERAVLIPNKSTDSFKARMASAPPAPPPSQPLPEAPTEAMIRNKQNESPSTAPALRRSDTEKPRLASFGLGSSPTKADDSSRILGLVEALSTAQKELAAQNQKIKEMEEALNTEREGRRSAEERATKLESVARDSPPTTSADSDEAASVTTNTEETKALDSDLQRRADTMRTELDEMKVLMEQYRQRAETAEAESSRDRQTLAEMVESIEKRNKAEQELLKSQADNNGNEDTCKSTLKEQETVSAGALDRAINRLHERKHSDEAPLHGLNGVAKPPMSVSELQQLGTQALAAALDHKTGQSSEDSNMRTPAEQALAPSRQHNQLVHTAPYASMLGVVILGMGIMAYLNGWQKATDR